MITTDSLLNDIIFPTFWKDEWKTHFLSQLMLVQLEKRQIQVLYDGGGWMDRHRITLNLLRQAAELCNMDLVKRFFVFTGDDYSPGVITPWNLLTTVGTREVKDTVLPDFSSFAWQEAGVADFESYRHEMINFSHDCVNENRVINKAYWRGSTQQHQSRKLFHDLVKDHASFDVQDTDGQSNFREMKYVGEYSVLIDLPGQGYSGRLKHLLFSGRPVVVYPRAAWDWVTLNLEPNVHFYLSQMSHVDLANSCINLLNSPEHSGFFVKNCFEKLKLMEKSTMISATAKIIQKCD